MPHTRATVDQSYFYSALRCAMDSLRRAYDQGHHITSPIPMGSYILDQLDLAVRHMEDARQVVDLVLAAALSDPLPSSFGEVD